jgi:tetratricopeptide (TPR) repeat protein
VNNFFGGRAAFGSGLALRNQICFPLLAFFLSAFSMFAQSTTSAPPKPDSPTRAKPDSAEAYYTLGSVLKQQGKLPEAAAALREAIRLQPEFAGAHTTLAAVLRQSGDTAGAAAESRAGSELARQKTSEQAAVFATNSGRRLRKAGDLDGAISQFRALSQPFRITLPHILNWDWRCNNEARRTRPVRNFSAPTNSMRTSLRPPINTSSPS